MTAVAGGSGALPAGDLLLSRGGRASARRRTRGPTRRAVAEVTVAVAAGGRVTVSWAPVAGATTYRVYRGAAPGAQDRYFGTAATSFVDDGSLAGVADTGTWATGTRWTVKNLFELKVGERVRVHGNLMEHCWKESQTGFAVLLTPRNQDATSPWVYVRDVTFTGNLVRHAGAGVQIEGYDTNATSAQTRRITIAHNIFDDINSVRWGGSGRWIQIGNGPSDLTVDHNTVLHDGHGDLRVWRQLRRRDDGGEPALHEQPAEAQHLWDHGRRAGLRDRHADRVLPGRASCSGTRWPGARPARYPAGTEFPTVAFWQGQFVDVAASNFALIPGSGYRASGTDALDLGAPVAQVEAAARAARRAARGRRRRWSSARTTLPDGRTGAAYAATLQASGGSGSYRWTLTAGALPSGLSLAAATGVLSGTPAQPGTFPITVQAQDAADPTNAVSQAYALTIASTPPAVSLTSPLHGATLVGTSCSARGHGDGRGRHGDAGGLLRECDHARQRVRGALVDDLGSRRAWDIPPHGRGDATMTASPRPVRPRRDGSWPRSRSTRWRCHRRRRQRRMP